MAERGGPTAKCGPRVRNAHHLDTIAPSTIMSPPAFPTIRALLLGPRAEVPNVGDVDDALVEAAVRLNRTVQLNVVTTARGELLKLSARRIEPVEEVIRISRHRDARAEHRAARSSRQRWRFTSLP